jgi:hypothetical protein
MTPPNGKTITHYDGTANKKRGILDRMDRIGGGGVDGMDKMDVAAKRRKGLKRDRDEGEQTARGYWRSGALVAFRQNAGLSGLNCAKRPAPFDQSNLKQHNRRTDPFDDQSVQLPAKSRLRISPGSHSTRISIGRQQISQSVMNRWLATLV